MRSRLRGCVLTATLALGCVTTGETAETTDTTVERLDPLPSDAQLELQGARIGEVRIHITPIFDLSDKHEDHRLFRLADRLHIDTRESTVQTQLLFGPGDLYSRHVLDETARNLRKQRYLREPQVRPVAFHDGVVDVEVEAQDVWTTSPGAGFGRAGGANSSSIEFEELNLFGFGKQVSVGWDRNVDRTSYSARWVDPAIFGSRWRDVASVTRSDDGHGYELGLERPFYSLNSHWSAGLTAVEDQGVDHFYALGERVASYGRTARTLDAHVGWSQGLQGNWAQRWTTGFRREASSFAPLDGLMPADRMLSYPYVRFEAIQDDFETTRNLDQIARTEDLIFGAHYAMELGWAESAFGSDRNAAIVRTQASRGFRVGKAQTLFLSGDFSGRLEHGSAVDSLLALEGRYYYRTSERSKLFVGLSGALGRNLDADHEFNVDGETGLRGYPLHYQAGSSRAVFTVEERLYTSWSLWHIAQIGGAVFADVGRTWGNSVGDGENLGLLKDVGFGLRLGNTRSSLANVLHLDVAFPLGADSSIRSVQFMVKTRQSF
jgi:hypothetical protein